MTASWPRTPAARCDRGLSWGKGALCTASPFPGLPSCLPRTCFVQTVPASPVSRKHCSNLVAARGPATACPWLPPRIQDINALEQHIKNLLSPSTPYFFNTLYDPYREGADFVRGALAIHAPGQMFAPGACSHGRGSPPPAMFAAGGLLCCRVYVSSLHNYGGR